MPLQVNELSLTELSGLTGIAVDKLKAELIVDSDTTPTETKIKELFLDTIVMKKADHATLLDNHGKNKFDDGKQQSLAQLAKVALGEKSFDVPKDMKREDFWSKVEAIKKGEWEAESGKVPDAKVKELQDEKTKLQNLISEKENEISKIKGEFEQTKTYSTAKEKVIAAVSAIPFEATGDVLNKQREIIQRNILSSYNHKIEDGVSVWYDSNGKKLVDNLQNPMSIEEIAKGEAIVFPTTKASTGRGDNSSKNNNHKSGELDAELSKLNTNEEFSKFMSARGLSPITEEGKALMTKWIELKNKKA
jgi:hypothetical protein